MIRKKGLEYLPSGMVEFMKGSGKMGNSMEEVSSGRKMWLEKDFGRREKESNG